MVIQTTLTQDEQTALLLALGAATGVAARNYDEVGKRLLIRVTNKLMANNPDFIPYDEDDPFKGR